MALLDFDAICKSELNHEPFEFFISQDLIAEKNLDAIRKDFPNIEKPGIFLLSALEFGPAFKALIDDIQSAAMRRIIGKKFGINLLNRPLMITVRGQAQLKDGQIHTDTKDKIVTCLLYLNDKWDTTGGRLRLLRNPKHLDSYAAEILPNGGTMASFKVAKNSWHGHKPYVGERRYVMFNWLNSGAALSRQIGRHKISAKVKKLIPFFYRDL